MKRLLKTFLLFVLASALTCSHAETKSNAHKTQKGYTKIKLPKEVSPQTMFRCSFKDKEGNLWFGTTGAGIYKYDGKLFTRYAEEEGLSNTIVYCISQNAKGQIWAVTDNGVFYSDGEKFTRLLLPISANRIQVVCILCDKKVNTWFGTENNGLWCYNGSAFRNFIIKDCTWREASTNFMTGNTTGTFVQSLLGDSKGNIWVNSFQNGLDYYDGVSFHRVNLNPLRLAEHKLNNSNASTAHIFQMFEDKKENIWMATRDDGICRYDGKTLESFTEKNGVQVTLHLVYV